MLKDIKFRVTADSLPYDAVYLHSPCQKMFPLHDAVVGFLHNTSSFSLLEDMWQQPPMATACQTELSMLTDTNIDRLGVLFLFHYLAANI